MIANRVTGTAGNGLSRQTTVAAMAAEISTAATTSIARRQTATALNGRPVRLAPGLAEQEERRGDVADALFPILAQAALNQRADRMRHIRGEHVPVGLDSSAPSRACRTRPHRRMRVCPVSISYSTQPNAQMSLRLSAGPPFACSGAMYAAVPRIMPRRSSSRAS